MTTSTATRSAASELSHAPPVPLYILTLGYGLILSLFRLLSLTRRSEELNLCPEQIDHLIWGYFCCGIVFCAFVGNSMSRVALRRAAAVPIQALVQAPRSFCSCATYARTPLRQHSLVAFSVRAPHVQAARSLSTEVDSRSLTYGDQR